MIIGIDLGTTNSLASCFRDGKAEIIPNRLGAHLTPSVVSVDADGNVYVGETAKEYGLLHPLECASVFKRSMGTDKEFVLSGNKYRAEELSGLVLKSLKEDAEEYLGEPVTEAIISVPAYFNDSQRTATKRAGELAGLTVNRIINEPTAAALAFGMDKQGGDMRYMVFDLGGGTFDVSILELHDFIMEVQSIAGDNFVGGENFTALLISIFLERAAVSPEDVGIRTYRRLYNAAEAWKIAFTAEKELELSFDFAEEGLIFKGEDGEETSVFSMTYTESEFEKACEPLLEKIRKPIERSLRDSNLSLADIDQIVLVGGATKMPIIRRFVSKVFKRFPGIFVDPDEAVAIGAALQCGIKNRDEQISEIVLTDICPFTLGTECMMHNGYFEEAGHYAPIIDRNTVIPVSRTKTFYTAHDNQKKVDIKILQGESRMAVNNLLLGEISVPVPEGPQGQESVDVTFTYDVNSLLEVEVCVVSTGVRRKVIIQGKDSRLTEEEAKERMEKLSYLKQLPRNEEANRLLILRGERLYEESVRNDRELINDAIMEFERALESQDRSDILDARKILTEVLDSIEFGDRN
ncbi:MAG: molecular chaperone HscC [Mogibacterium sp.]|nr:molecular chaperone HscC [Mogibacterium sp.]